MSTKKSKKQALDKRKRRAVSLHINKIKRALIGASVSLKHSDGEDAPVRLQGFEKALQLADGKADLICEITTGWCLNWQIEVVVYCESETEFEEQPVVVTAKNQPIKNLRDFIEDEVIPFAKSECKNTIIDCGWHAVVTEE